MEKITILISDSADLIRCLEKDFLRRRNFHLLVAHDSREALTVMAREQPDLAFLDLDLDGMEEAKICSSLQGDPRLSALKAVLIVSGRPCKELLGLCRSGLREIMSKPLHRGTLTHLTRRLLQVGIRGDQRYVVSLPIVYEVASGQARIGHVRNLSLGGLLLEAGSALPVDDELILEFDLPQRASSVRCRGRVVWVGRLSREKADLPYGLGVQFIDLDANDKEILRTYLEQEGGLFP